MEKLENLYEEVQHRKQETYQILLDYGYPDEKIKELCEQFISTPRGDLRQKYKDDEITYYGIMALILYMNLEVKLPPPNKGHVVDDESLADIVLDAMHATLCLVKAGWKPAEPLAIQQLKMRQNQRGVPRNRKTPEKDDLFMRYKDYIIDRGRPPGNIENFYSYLTANGYEIDRAEGKEGTIDHRDWKKTISLATLSRKWFPEMAIKFNK